MKKKIKAIVFDLGDTLIKIDHLSLLKNAGLEGRFIERQVFNLLEGPAQMYEKGEINSRTFFSLFKEKTETDLSFEKFKYAWCSVATGIIEGMDELLSKLKNKLPLFLLSNTNELHFNYIKTEFAIMDSFDKFFLSYKIGSVKPDPIIYKHVLKNLRMNPSDLFFIDDKLQNVLAAKKEGIEAVHFKTLKDLLQGFDKYKIME
jgi:glucose-1-phosphatase